MSVRYTAEKLRELKNAHDRDVIDDICSDIGDGIICAAEGGMSSVTAILSDSTNDRNIITDVNGIQFEQLRARVADLEAEITHGRAVPQITSSLIDIVAKFGKIVESLPEKKA